MVPGRWTKASLFTRRYATPGSTPAPMLIAAAKPTLRSSRTGRRTRARPRLSPQAWSVTSPIRRYPFRYEGSTQRIV